MVFFINKKMKIKINQIKIPDKLELSSKINDDVFLNSSINYVDDGYELTQLEREIYQLNNIIINDQVLNHYSCTQHWFSIESDKIFCDHSCIMLRYSLEDYKDQILKLRKKRKELIKFFDIKSKYGLDFYFQFLDENNCFDIIHIENDYIDKDELIENKELIENFIPTIDWEDVGLEILKRKYQWENLPKDDQHDWKARYFGFPRAFHTKK